MRFKDFLNEAPGQYKGMAGESKDSNDLAKTLNAKAHTAITQIAIGNILYRGVKQSDHTANFTFKYGRDIKRKSIQSYGEHYTDILSALPSWQKFNAIAPRNFSAICSSDFSKAENYADTDDAPYIIFPVDGTTLLVCSDSDIKTSFPNLSDFGEQPQSRQIDTATLSRNLGPLLKAALGNDAPKSVNFIKSLKSMTLDMVNISVAKNSTFKPYKRMLEYTKSDNLFDALDKIMDPTENGFDEITLSSKYPKNTEIWFRSDFGSVKMQKEPTKELVSFCSALKLDIKWFIL